MDSKQSNEEDIKSIGRYLNRTKYKGVVFTPDGSNGIKYYASADFFGPWCIEDADQVDSVLSRTGYIFEFTNFPIVWVSKIQAEIDLSKT